MAKFKGKILNCRECGTEFKVPQCRADTAEFCSIKCASKVRNERQRKRVTLSCAHCADSFESVACHANRRIYCSNECREASAAYRTAKSDRMQGDKNPSWVGGFVDHSEGYIYARAPGHPFASNGYVLQHRLVMEQWLRENDPESPFLIKLGDQRYLSPGFEVHHRDEIKRNNLIGNLQCLTRSEHQKVHNELRRKALNEEDLKP